MPAYYSVNATWPKEGARSREEAPPGFGAAPADATIEYDDEVLQGFD
jgi:hypothetical protein